MRQKTNSQLKLEIKEELIELSSQCKDAFDSDNGPLGETKGHEVDINFNVERLSFQLLRGPYYPYSPGYREELGTVINELIKLRVLTKV
ncbi:hypothetical protein O181_094109 [Austropuccinia psidii MF-1]|uniref:Uncharacterized protein n=1 Tax=Austropuccinia psidii MF-1 TaxID=1389203 RepID=A0A9Q3J2S3_9BASI|nr:hypothetical protein [Austropuccinia psidii MF-1]